MARGNCVTYALSHFFDIAEDEIIRRMDVAGYSDQTGGTGVLNAKMLKVLGAIGETFGPSAIFLFDKPTVQEVLDRCDDTAYFCIAQKHAFTIKNKRIFDLCPHPTPLSEPIGEIRARSGVIDFLNPDSVEDPKGGWVAYNNVAHLMV